VKEKKYYWIVYSDCFLEVNDFLNSNFTKKVLDYWIKIEHPYMMICLTTYEDGSKHFAYIEPTITSTKLWLQDKGYIYKGEITQKTIRREKLKKINDKVLESTQK
jgi:hypothetical protein